VDIGDKMFVTLGELECIFNFCIIGDLFLLIGNPQQKREARYSASDLLGDVDEVGLRLIFENPYEKIWSIEDLEEHNLAWSKDIQNEYDDSSYSDWDNLEVFISPKNVEVVAKKFYYTKLRVAEEVLNAGFDEFCYTSELFEDLCRYLNLTVKIEHGVLTPRPLEVARIISKLNNKRFYHAISEIIILCIERYRNE
jgi:hypothetical protein